LKTVAKALNALDLLAVLGGRVGVRELAECLGVDKSSTHRLLTTLERHGYAAQDPVTGKYQLGMRVFQAGGVLDEQVNLRVLAHPHLERLAEASGEVVHLAVLNGSSCVYVDKVQGPNAITMASQIGWRKPLYCTGVGKVLLAHAPRERYEPILRDQELRALTANTITDLAELRSEIRAIRAGGVAFDREEIEPGLRCVAVPVHGAKGQAVAALSVAGPSDRFGPKQHPRLLQLARDTAEAISRDLLSTEESGVRSQEG